MGKHTTGLISNDTSSPRRLGHVFWMLSTIEMLERLAYFGMRMVVPIYIMQADEPGGLHFTALQKGTIYSVWALVQSLLPMFTGGYADRYGYKKTIAVSITVKIAGYVLMATQRTYVGFLAGAVTLAAGTAIFKPGIQGSLAHCLHKDNASLGWGLFYQFVNIGAWLGPFLAHYLKGIGWPAVFYGCAGIVAINYLMLFSYADPPSGAPKAQGFFKVFKMTMTNIVNARLIALILILASFWMMMYQIWDLHPTFIVDWVDSTRVAEDLKVLPDVVRNRMIVDTDRGVQVSQEQLVNVNSLMVMLFVSAVAFAVAKVRRLWCMTAGMVLATFGVVVAGWTMSGYTFLLGIVLFSLGEMLTGPKKNEYFGLIAPPGKKGLYLGYVNIPVAIGPGVGGLLGGYMYGNYGEKAVLALKYIAQYTELGAKKGWNGATNTLEATLGIPRTEAFAALQQILGQNASEVTQLLWDMYHPYYVWIPFASVGVVATAALCVFSWMSKKWVDMDV